MKCWALVLRKLNVSKHLLFGQILYKINFHIYFIFYTFFFKFSIIKYLELII